MLWIVMSADENQQRVNKHRVISLRVVIVDKYHGVFLLLTRRIGVRYIAVVYVPYVQYSTTVAE